MSEAPPQPLRKRSLAEGSSLLAFGLFLLWCQYQHPLFPATDWGLFAQEYGNLAESLCQGKGLSNPFAVETGPSAWMPPLLPLMMAGVFQIAGVKTPLAAYVLITGQLLALWVSLLFLILCCRRTELPPWAVTLVFTFLVYLNPRYLFQNFHDVGLVILVSTFLLYGLVRLLEGSWIWVSLAACLLPVTSPSLCLALVGAASLQPALRKRGLVVAVVAMVLVIFGWGIRNQRALGKFVPLKSNLWFELHMANVSDLDGIPTSTTFFNHHPIGKNKEVLEHYQRAGEMKFMADHQGYFLIFFNKHPQTWVRRIVNRLGNATLWLAPEFDFETIHTELGAGDIRILDANDVLAPRDSYVAWLTPPYPPLMMKTHMFDVWELDQPELAYEEWFKARERRTKRRRSLWTPIWSLSLTLLPSLALVLLWFGRELRKNPVYLNTAALYVFFLLPYVLVSHYERYQIMTIGMSSLMVTWLAREAYFRLSAQFRIPNS